MATIEITKVNAGQLELLQQIARISFFETFAAVNSEENMQKYLQESFALDKLAAELADPATSFYFACIDGQVVGYLKVNVGPAQTELQDDKALEIERIYVLSAFHGQAVGQRLYEEAMWLAKELGIRYVWLGVWEENSRAIRFYAKNGFVAFDKHIFRLGDDEQTDILMKKMC
jgi:ribosomal protein S18 acetylase RimI-like enzyme